MGGRAAALALAVGLVGAGTASAQPSGAAGLLLPPVAVTSTGTSSPRTDAPLTDPIPPVRTRRPDPEPPAPAPTRSPAARLAPPRDVTPVSATVPAEDNRRTERPAGRDDLFDYLSDGRRPRREREADDDDRPRSAGKFGDRMRDAVDAGGKRGWFGSDHEFDCFVSPVTNPFLFEDPRALTEIKGVGVYQKVPSPQFNFKGGDAWFGGLQGRVAFGDRFSLVLHKIGAVGVDPAGESLFRGGAGLSELWVGPKVTLIRNPDSQTLLSAGAIFQVALGQSKVFQDTGDLSIAPYLSYGQNFFKTRWGSFNALATGGYSFATSRQRSDYLYASGHLDWDVANAHRFFPLVELNWVHYTTDGQARPITGEGRDLFNFGGQAKGSGLLTGAVGARAKLFKRVEIGAAFEVPLVGQKDFFRYRVTGDLIWRF